jgi:hypothetical protein
MNFGCERIRRHAMGKRKGKDRIRCSTLGGLMRPPSSPDRGPELDDRVRTRLRRAGRRFEAAQAERRAAVTELKKAIGEADGSCTAADAADLTGVSSHLLAVIQPDLRRSHGRAGHGEGPSS